MSPYVCCKGLKNRPKLVRFGNLPITHALHGYRENEVKRVVDWSTAILNANIDDSLNF